MALEVTVMGVDPGLANTGYAVLVFSSGQGLPRILEAGLVRTEPSTKLPRRLDQIHSGLLEVLQEHRPDRVVIEDLYSNYNHPRTAILMGHARGVSLLAAARAGVPVHTFAPTRVKQALTGRGNADKEQVQRMVQSQLGLASPPEPDHVADAMAMALAYRQYVVGAAALAAGREGP